MTTSPTAPPHSAPTRPPLDLRVIGAVAFTVVAWASAFVVIRYVARDVSPGALSLGRLVVAAVVLSALMLRGKRIAMTRREWLLVVVIGVAWFAVYNVALNAGEQRVDAGTAAMLIQLAPILIGVLAGLLLGEGFPKMLVIGGLVAFAGTIIIGVSTSTGHADLIGVALVLLSAVVYAVAMVAQKIVLRRISGLQVTWLACLIGMVVCLPFAGSLVRDLSQARPSAIGGIVYLGVIPTALAFTTSAARSPWSAWPSPAAPPAPRPPPPLPDPTCPTYPHLLMGGRRTSGGKIRGAGR